MILDNYLVFVLFISLVPHIRCDCIPLNSSTPPISESFDNYIPLTENRIHRLFCCIYGVTTLEWTFQRKDGPDVWTKIVEIKDIYRLSDNNRTLSIVRPKLRQDTGSYRCAGNNNAGISVTEKLYAEVFPQNFDLNFKILSSSNLLQVFQTISNHTFFCVIYVHRSYNPEFMWNRVINNEYLPLIKEGKLHDFRMNGDLIEGYTGKSNVTIVEGDDFNKYNFSLTLYFIDYTFEGDYNCQISGSEKESSMNFTLYFKRKDALPKVYLIGVSCCFIVILTLVIIFYYDIKIFLRAIFRLLIYRKYSTNKFNFFILYNFNDEFELNLILNIVKNLEAEGYICYFHHRNQIYGKDTLEDINDSLRQSDLVVIWISSQLFNCDIYNFSMQMLLHNYKNTKRIYVITSSKKKIAEYCMSKIIMTDLNSTFGGKIYKMNYLTTFMDMNYNPLVNWRKHKFLSWLTSSLPLKSFPRAIVL